MTVKYKVAVVGCGSMSDAWIDYALRRPDMDVVALVDIKLEFANAKREKKELSCGTYTDAEEAIRQSGANVVFDITIPASHFDIRTKAMKLGCDVFGEKPLAENMEQCAGIVRVSGETGRTHAVMQNYRYNAQIRAFRRLIADGKIGKVAATYADFFVGPHFGGFRDIMDSPLILDMAIHTFDAARMITGANPAAVYAHEFNPHYSWYKGDVSAICIFEMADGSIFNYRGSWCAEGAPTSWNSSWRIVGGKGTAIWDGHSAPWAETIEDPQEGKWTRDLVRTEADLTAFASLPGGHHGCLDDMFAALEAGRPAETDCRDNIHSMAMVLGALESSRTGKKVTL